MSDLKILFELRDVAEIIPWGTPPDLRLSWFGLTDGVYCIETKAGRLLEYEDGSSCGYPIARLFEDLIDVLPQVLEPVPDDVATRFLAWQSDPATAEVPDDDQLADAWFEAQEWWGWRQLDFGYLTASPLLHFWRVGADVHMRWRTPEHKTASRELTVRSADLVLPVEAFQACASAFFRDFLSAMRQRVELIARDGWSGQDCEIDIPGLIAQQGDRENEPLNLMGYKRRVDWDVVRRRLTQLGF